MKRKSANGAGLVVISRDLRKVLVLWNKNKLDLPKGSIERGESSIETAFREAQEEANIDRESCELISKNPVAFDNIHFYYTFWEGTAKILPNPKTGILEHDKIEWITWRKAINNAPEFLKPALFHGVALCAIIPSRSK